MIGSGLKKLAKENGMKVAGGVGYGALRGYAVTLSEGAGYKQISIATRFTDPVKKQALLELIGGKNLTREFRVQNFGISERSIQIIFTDNPGTMKKIEAFIDWFFPLLPEHSATGVNICADCGCELTAGRWVLVEGVAYYLHESCSNKLTHEIDADNTRRKEEDTGSYLTGFLGALGGSVIGAVLWAIVLNMGYVASIVGLVIGWLAEKGYNLLRGKQGKGKVFILILVVILGVVLGTFAADAITLVGMINNGQLPGFSAAEIPTLIFALLAEDADYRSGTTTNILMGLLFAALGVYALIRKAGKEVADTKIKHLD